MILHPTPSFHFECKYPELTIKRTDSKYKNKMLEYSRKYKGYDIVENYVQELYDFDSIEGYTIRYTKRKKNSLDCFLLDDFISQSGDYINLSYDFRLKNDFKKKYKSLKILEKEHEINFWKYYWIKIQNKNKNLNENHTISDDIFKQNQFISGFGMNSFMSFDLEENTFKINFREKNENNIFFNLEQNFYTNIDNDLNVGCNVIPIKNYKIQDIETLKEQKTYYMCFLPYFEDDIITNGRSTDRIFYHKFYKKDEKFLTPDFTNLIHKSNDIEKQILNKGYIHIAKGRVSYDNQTYGEWSTFEYDSNVQIEIINEEQDSIIFGLTKLLKG